MISKPPRPRCYIQEVAPRDGFQNERKFVPTASKISFINALSQTGLAKIEATSFTSPKVIPALADAEAVMNGVERVAGVCYTALVPNVRGAERALATRVDEFNLVMSVSETHNLTNLRMTREQSAKALAQTLSLAQSAEVPVNVSLSCVFGCPMEGDIAVEDALGWAARFIGLGAGGVTLCDTTGMAFPTQVAGIVGQFKERWPATTLTLHFHNTRGMGLANVVAAVQAGADRFDAALGGIGGCPYAPGATGNVCTEDVVHMLELMGYDTGVNLARLLAAASDLPGLVDHEVPGQVVKAGPRLKLHSPPRSFAEISARAAGREIAP
jgi:hydroxymethylglutaryl-CoA lyase